jgi:hypothetical protein
LDAGAVLVRRRRRSRIDPAALPLRDRPRRERLAGRVKEPPIDHEALRRDLSAYWREAFPHSFPERGRSPR